MTNLGNLGMGIWSLFNILKILKDGDQDDKDNFKKIISLGAKAAIKMFEDYLNPPADDTNT